MVSIIARYKDEVALSPVDFFSIGHVLMGQIVFFAVYHVARFLLDFASGYALKLGLVSAVGIGMLWEPFENFMLYRWGYKFEGRRDSLINSIADIIFVSIGALASYYYPLGILHLAVICVEFTAFFYFRYRILYKKSEWIRQAEMRREHARLYAES